MKSNKLIVSLLTVPVIAGVYFGSAVLNQVSANPAADCDAQVDLQGSVSHNTATVTNYSANQACSYDATLAVYDSPQKPETYGWIDAQTLIGSKSVTVKPGETVTITVEGTGTGCYNQADLIRGTEVLTPPYYRDAMDTDVYEVNSGVCTCTPTPTPGVSVTPTPTGTPGSTPTPTPENKVGAASYTQLAGTGDQVLTIAFIVAGAVSLLVAFLSKKKILNI